MTRVVVKFVDSVALRYVDDVGAQIPPSVGDWPGLQTRFPAIRIYRLYRAIAEADLLALVSRAKAREPAYSPPNFLTYYFVEFDAAFDANEVAAQIAAWPGVEQAYPEFDAALASPAPIGPTVQPSVPTMAQAWQHGAPIGIGIECAWKMRGGDGAHQSFVDVETGWTLNHHAYASHTPAMLGGTIYEPNRAHGTAVLGIVCAAPQNPVGILGVAPNVPNVGVVSYYHALNAVPLAVDVPGAIALAAHYLPAGGVLLVEAQLGYLPCEADPACRRIVELVTSGGVCVVEAAGNGGTNLDTWVDPFGHRSLFRSPANPAYVETRAIIVAAADSALPHHRRLNSNYGARIDCYAWGDDVCTSWSNYQGDQASLSIPPDFMNTSAAAAIVAGAALSVQGIVEAATNTRLPPLRLRTALRHGTPSADPIGIMPDMCAILRMMDAGLHRRPDAPRA